MIESLYILIITAIACAILGVFLVLRNLSMITDAISHTILLGIVLAYFIVQDLSSPYLIIGAAVFGVFTTFCIELLTKAQTVSEDASVGIIFPLFFSIAVILITKFASNVHLDTDMVLMGEIIMAPLNRIQIFHMYLPKSLVTMLAVLILNIVYITFFYRRLKISTFDGAYAKIIGIGIGFLYYSFMGMVSLTAVAAFDSVGAILTIAFFIAPAASAYLLTKRLKNTLFFSVIYAIINSTIGYFLAVYMNVSISGMCACISGLTFMLTYILSNCMRYMEK